MHKLRDVNVSIWRLSMWGKLKKNDVKLTCTWTRYREKIYVLLAVIDQIKQPTWANLNKGECQK